MPRIQSYPLLNLPFILFHTYHPQQTQTLLSLSSLSMATSFSCFTPTSILSSTSSNHRILQSSRRGISVAASSNSWWTPLFGWSSDPDYIHTSTNGSVIENQESADSGTEKQSKSRFSLGCFTEEKAKQLRMKTMETATFHDIMYHSAIASRLASDVSGCNDS